ncbi:MAG: response regulator [Rhodospirillaceae bacterium]|nr:response regulator [Rhodospirillaceae bacterium]MBT7266616.1 response regulator [Rhodospirillaceae bacterium]
MKTLIFRPNSLIAKLLAIYLPLVSLSVVILFGVLEARFYFSGRSELIDELKQLVSVQDTAFASAVWEIDTDQINTLLAEIGRLPNIQSAEVFDTSGENLGGVGNTKIPPETKEFRVERDLVYRTSKVTETVGKLIVTVHSRQILQAVVTRLKLDFLILIVMAVTLVGVTILSTRYVIGRPLARLRTSIEKLRNENIREQVDWESSDELGEVVQAYNEMQLNQAIAENELKLHQDHLEDSILERTQELEKAKDVAESANTELASRIDDLADARRATLNMMADAEESRRKAEELREEAEAATNAKSSFLAAMSHEIRTPMNGIVGMIDLLRETKLSTDQGQMMQTVRDSAFSLLQIINDILDFSKIEAGKMELENIPVSIRDMMQGVVDTLVPNAAKKDLMVIPYIDPAIPEFVMADQVRLRQILFNLAGNALKFTESTEERQGKVIIRADRQESDDDKIHIRYSVGDNGIGISEEAQEKLFEAFTQAESSTTRRFGGTGLGLSICVRLTNLMGGDVAVNSEMGKGSDFYTIIPHDPSDRDVKDSEDKNLEGLSVLVVTEIAEYAEFLSNYLRHWKAGVEIWDEREAVASQVTEATFNDEIYDVVILGIDIEEKAQEEIRQVFGKYEANAETKFVMLRPYWRRGARIDDPGTVTLDALPIRRPTFITAVAVAAGRASPEVKKEEERTTAGRKTAPTIEEAAEMGQLILVAEDNLTNQDVIRRQLNMLGYAVEMFDNGQLALDAWEKNSYAILLTDCHMPEMDGYELTGEIRKREDDVTDRFPIIAITANALQGEAERCLEAGMDDYLSKPLEMPKLRQALGKWMPVSALGEPANYAPPAEDELTTSDEEPEIAESTGGDQIAEPDKPAEKPTNGPIDPAALRDVFGDDDETFKEILNEFIEPGYSNVAEIKSAFDERSAKDVASAAHKLKSSSRAIGANYLADLCLNLETAGKSDDWDVIDQDAPKLDGAIEDVIAYINGL